MKYPVYLRILIISLRIGDHFFLETIQESTAIHKKIKFELISSSKIISWLNRSASLNWEQVLLFALTTFAILSRFLGLSARVMSHDESLHVYFSWLLSTGNGFVHTPMMHGPLLFELTALLNFLFGANDFTSRLLPTILGVFITIGIPQLLKPWIGRLGALVGSTLFLISPYMLYYSRYIRHDMLIIAWMLLLVFSIMGYLFTRNDRYLVLFAAALALMFSSMEITFIYLAIFAGFLLVRMISEHGLQWKALRASAEFDLLILMITLGLLFSSPIILLVLNPLFVQIAGVPFINLSVLGSQGMEWTLGETGERLWLLFFIFAAISFVLGYVWGKFRWLKLFSIFLTITVLLYTTFFTNFSGFASGFIGSLGYWLSQQQIARGGQPLYYYLIVMPMYEYFTVIGGFCAAVYYLKNRKELPKLSNIFIPFVLWWAIFIFIALSLAGEKMPWLSTHITVPFLLLTAWWIGQIVERNRGVNISSPKWVRILKRIGFVAISILFLLTVRTSFLVNYVNFDYVTEFIDYAHGAPGVKWVMNELQAIANHTGIGKDLKIAYDDEVSWPMSWYLKDYPNRVLFGKESGREAFDAPVVIAGPKNWNKLDAFLGSKYHRFEVVRLWWPIEDYKNLTWERIQSAISDADMRAALWDIFWARDYTRYASLTGSSLYPPSNWSLAEKMRVYVKKDIALEMLRMSLGNTMLEEKSEKTDLYAGIWKNINADLTISSGGLNNPRNISVGPDGSLYVLDTGNSRVVKYNQNGDLVNSWGRQTLENQNPPLPGTFNEPWGITIDSENNVYVADTWNHRIQKFDSQGNFLIQWGKSGLAEEGLDRLWGPRGIAVSPDGRIFVTDTGNKRVVAYSSEGKALFEFEKEGESKLDEPVGITLGKDEKVYIADTWNMRVAIFTQDGSYVASFPIQGWESMSIDNKPFLTSDYQGNIYITDPEGYRVLVFSGEGKPLSVFGQNGVDEGSFGITNGISSGLDATIWLADAENNRLLRYSGLLR
ncbi:MAG: hypothetical protein CL609_15355 [Anaerolineaceae bacterium]|nr:hypothetical protein [Anaerolineaceae bacterium]